MKRNLLLDPDPPQGGGGGGGTTPPALTQADLHAAIEKARMEEREKLRSQLETAQTKTKTLETQVTELTQKLTKVSDDLAALQKVQATTKDGQAVDVKSLIAEVTANVEKRFAEATAQERQQLTTEVQTLRQNVTQFQIKELRDKLIVEAGGSDKMVLSLVQGNDEASLRASIKSARDAYDEIANKVKGTASGNSGSGQTQQTVTQNGSATATAAAGTAPPMVNTAGQGGAGGGTEGNMLANARQMSASDYASNRAKILGDLKRRYPPTRR